MRIPRLTDLRDSGAIEQDAETITFLYPDPVLQQEEEDEGQREGPVAKYYADVAKNRQGPLGRAAFTFRKPQFKFETFHDEVDATGDFFDEKV